jgi:hypothetical protein
MSSDFNQQLFQRTQFKHKPSDLVQAVDHEAVKKSLAVPARGLAVTGILSVALAMGGLFGGFLYSFNNEVDIKEYWSYQIFGDEPEPERTSRRPDSKKEEERKARKANKDQAAFTIVMGVIGIGGMALGAMYMVFAVAGLMMGQLRKYRLCRIACILAMIPGISPLIVGGIPFGIIGLKKLSNRDTKKAFLT